MNSPDSDLVMYDLRVSDSDDSNEELVTQTSPPYHHSSVKQLELDAILLDIGGFGKL